MGIIVDQLHNAVLGIDDARGGVGRVAFRSDALVPVVIRISRILQFDRFQVGILARRLIEVPVNANVVHGISWEARFAKTTNEYGPSRNSRCGSDMGAESSPNPLHEPSAE